MKMNEHMQERINNLRAVSNGNFRSLRNFDSGLCLNFFRSHLYVHKLLTYFEEWPEFSGERYFPVEGEEIYKDSSNKYQGGVGAKRMRLAGYLADRLEEDYANT